MAKVCLVDKPDSHIATATPTMRSVSAMTDRPANSPLFLVCGCSCRPRKLTTCFDPRRFVLRLWCGTRVRLGARFVLGRSRSAVGAPVSIPVVKSRLAPMVRVASLSRLSVFRWFRRGIVLMACLPAVEILAFPRAFRWHEHAPTRPGNFLQSPLRRPFPRLASRL